MQPNHLISRLFFAKYDHLNLVTPSILLLYVDTDECANDENDCHRDAVCLNNIGSFSCVCRVGFQQFQNGRLCLKEEEGMCTLESTLSNALVL